MHVGTPWEGVRGHNKMCLHDIFHYQVEDCTGLNSIRVALTQVCSVLIRRPEQTWWQRRHTGKGHVIKEAVIGGHVSFCKLWSTRDCDPKEQEEVIKYSSLEASERAWFYQWLDFGLLALRTEKEKKFLLFKATSFMILCHSGQYKDRVLEKLIQGFLWWKFSQRHFIDKHQTAFQTSISRVCWRSSVLFLIWEILVHSNHSAVIFIFCVNSAPCVLGMLGILKEAKLLMNRLLGWW